MRKAKYGDKSLRKHPILGIYAGDLGNGLRESLPELHTMYDLGIESIRTFSNEQTRVLMRHLMRKGVPAFSLFPGLYLDRWFFLRDDTWRIIRRELDYLISLDIPIPQIALGNEIVDRSEPIAKRRAVYEALQSLIRRVKDYLKRRGSDIQITTCITGKQLFEAIDGLACSKEIDGVMNVCDIISINIYPVTKWFGLEGLSSNRALLIDHDFRGDLFDNFESKFAGIIDVVAQKRKRLLIAETGISSGIGWRTSRGRTVVLHDRSRYERALRDWMSVFARLYRYNPQFLGVYLFEWIDNPEHSEIVKNHAWVHAAFGLQESNRTFKVQKARLRSIFNVFKMVLNTDQTPKSKTGKLSHQPRRGQATNWEELPCGGKGRGDGVEG